MSPTLNVNLTLHVNPCTKIGHIYIFLNVSKTITWYVIFIQLSFIHDNIPYYYDKMQNTPYTMDELKVNRDDNI